MTRPTAYPWMSFLVASAATWLSFVVVLHFLVQPLTWTKGQTNPVTDVTALLDAALLAALVHVACWLPHFTMAWDSNPSKAALLGIASTWLASSGMFLWIEGIGQQFVLDHGLTSRAAEVLANGQDIIFMPIVIPVLTIVSGSLFTFAVWASNRCSKSIAGR